MWDLGSGGMMEEYQPSLHLPNRGVVSALAFNPDGALLASSTNFNCVRIYNGKQLGTSNNRYVCGTRLKCDHLAYKSIL